MKRITAPIALALLLLTACDKVDPVEPTPACDGSTGTIRVKNTSLHTVQRILIDGANHGSLDPGEEQSFSKNPGNYSVQLWGLSGGAGCNAATLHVVACDTEGLSCSN